jgi:hypothetical protein
MSKVNSQHNDRPYLLIIFAAVAASQLVQLVSPGAADVFFFLLIGIYAAIVTYRLLKRKNTLQEWLAWMVGFAAIAGAQIAGSTFKNDAAAYAIVLTATAGLLFFFAVRLVRGSGASWRYNLAGVIASVSVIITIIGLILLRGIIEANYLLIIALVGAFCALIAVDKGQKTDAATQKQIEGSGKVLKAEPLREKVKEERR